MAQLRPVDFDPFAQPSGATVKPVDFDPFGPKASFMDRVLQAAKPEQGIFRGMRDPIDAGAQMLVRGASAVGLAPESEVARVDQMNREAEQAYQAQRVDSGFDPARLAGNIIATAPLTGAVPVGGSLAARTALGGATGAGFGALQPVENPGEDFWSQKGRQAGTGAAAGALAAPLTSALARIVQPKTAPEVKTLMKEGVTPTPGQVLGGAWKASEEKMSSMPFLGDVIRSGQRRGIEQMNTAAYQRALEPIGVKMPAGLTGRDAFKFADDALGQYYDDVLARVGPTPLDRQLSTEMTQILGKLSGTPDKARQFVTELQRELGERARNGVLNGQGFKDVESWLGDQARRLIRENNTASERALGEAYRDAQHVFRQWLERAAPAGVADDVARANQGWASFVRIRDAATMQGAKGGEFTAAQLGQGVRRNASKTSFGKGEALMQDLSDAAQKVLSQEVPDSGTTGRALMTLLAGAGGAAVGSGVLSPGGLLALTAPMAAYTRPGQATLAALLARRPELAEPVSNAVRQAGIPVLTGGLYGLLGQ